jgi:hypothetical protein
MEEDHERNRLENAQRKETREGMGNYPVALT